jgi:hypothetical protein
VQQGQSQRNNQCQHNNDDIIRSTLAKMPPCKQDDAHEMISGGEVGSKEPNNGTDNASMTKQAVLPEQQSFLRSKKYYFTVLGKCN